MIIYLHEPRDDSLLRRLGTFWLEWVKPFTRAKGGQGIKRFGCHGSKVDGKIRNQHLHLEMSYSKQRHVAQECKR